MVNRGEFLALHQQFPAIVADLQEFLPFLDTGRKLLQDLLKSTSEVDFHLTEDLGGYFQHYSLLGLLNDLLRLDTGGGGLLLLAHRPLDPLLLLLFLEVLSASVVASRQFLQEMRELFFRFYRLVRVCNILKVPPLRDDSSPQHVANYNHTLGNWFLSLWHLDQLLPFQALSDVLLMDAYFALPELSTITGIFYLLCLGLCPESLGFVEPVQYDDRLYVLWHFCKVYRDSLVHVYVFSGRAKIDLVSQETAKLFVDFSENQLINNLSFFIKEQ